MARGPAAVSVPPKSPPPRNIPPILAVFLFSGAAGLAYEIVWARQLSLTLGAGIYAVSATLVAFMGGLGMGAAISGRALDRGVAPIRLYALCEAALGIYVLSFPLAWRMMDAAYLALHGGAEGATVYVTALRLGLAVMVLAFPTMLMGATLPAVVRHCAGAEDGPPGTVYAVNTLGAMAGCVAAGFFLIENFGLTSAMRIGVLVNLSCAAAAWALAGESGWRMAAPAKSASGQKEMPADLFLLALYGITGFCGLALELLWTRSLILLLNNTTYAFSLVLSVFLLGTAAGSALAARVEVKSSERAYFLFGAMMAGAGVMALASLAAFSLSGPAIGFISGFAGGGWIAGLIPGGATMAPALVFALAVITPCTAALGACFPLAVAAAAPEKERIGGGVGRLYAVNTAGCVVGSLVAGYFLIPGLGVQTSVLLVAAVALLAGLAAAFLRGGHGARWLAAAAMALAPPIAGYLMMNPDIAFRLSAGKLDAGAEVEFYEEGPSATVLVSKNESDLAAGRKPIRRLWINGDPIAGTFREALQLERLQAHIPLLLITNPKTALVICFGTGSTAGAALAHGLDSVTAVDISREVFHAGPKFIDGNRSPAASKQFHMVEEDGRNYLKTTSRFFDFITSEPPPPSNAGVASLYTAEYYRLARARLNPGGALSQWIPIHHLSGDDLKRLVAAFLEAFPEGAMWYTKWDVIMIGSAGVMPDAARLYRAFDNPDVKASLAQIGIYRTEQILANHMMGPDQLRRYVNGVEALRDDWPVVEFTAPKIHAIGVQIKGENLAEILKYRQPQALAGEGGGGDEARARAFDSQTEFFRGQVAKSAGNMGQTAGHYEEALKIDADNSEAAYALLSLNVEMLHMAAGSAAVDKALMMVDRTEKLDARGLFTVQLKFLRGFLLARQENNEAAAKEMSEAVALDADYFSAVVNLAGLYAQKLGQPGKALELYKRALGLRPTPEERKALEEAINTISRKGNGS